MSAVLFGSISTIADTSELQREAFNEAFKVHGLDWQWDRDEYVAMLGKSGGQARIADYAQSLGRTVDAAAVHETKSEIFQNSLADASLEPRAGVVETIQGARSNGLKVALVTTTSRANLTALGKALGPQVQLSDFDLVVDSSSVQTPKPDPAAFNYALRTLGEKPGDCVAIEDNEGGVAAAVAAGLTCIAFPNENTARHTFESAQGEVDHLDFQRLRQFVTGS